jgi:hypothetical protein
MKSVVCLPEGSTAAVRMRAVAADDARIERRDHGLVVRRQPAFAPTACHQRMEGQILNDDLLIALKTTVRSIFNLSRLLPRRRVDRPAFVSPAPSFGRSVSIPDGFCGGRGGSFF